MKDACIIKVTHWLENVSGVACDDWTMSFNSEFVACIFEQSAVWSSGTQPHTSLG